MSIVQACWFSVRRAWEEYLSGAALFIAAGSLVLWHAVWPPMLQVVLWALWGLSAAFLLRRGWLKLFGPVLFYDMIRQARRGRYILLRIVYVGVLIYFFLTTWYQVDRMFGHRLEPQKFYAFVAERYFDVFMIIQFVAVCMLTPAYVAGCIAEEKERKTLEFMLATDLRNREIILSKLVSRLANLGLFVITGLPILSILQFLGGLDPNLVLAGFLATFMTMVGLASFSVLCSVHFKKPRDAIASAYLGPLVYVAAGLVGFGMQRSGWVLLNEIGMSWAAPALSEFVTYYNMGNLVVSLAEIARALSFGRELGTVLGGLLTDYVIFHALFGLACTVWAIARLRSVALRQASEPPRKFKTGRGQRPPVSDEPVFWREAYVEGRGRSSWTMRVFIGCLILLIGGWFVGFVIDSMLRGQFMTPNFKDTVSVFIATISTVLSCLIVLGAAVRASTSISSERDKDTFDFLLTTPLDSDAILWQKFKGNLYCMRWAFYGLLVVWLTGFVFGGLSLEVVPLMIGVVIYSAAFSLIGLWFSIMCRSGIRATVATVMTSVILSVGHWVPCICVYAGGGRDLKVLVMAQAGITPPAVFGILHAAGMAFRRGYGDGDMAGFVVFTFIGMGVYAMGARFFWSATLLPRFREATNRGENRGEQPPWSAESL